MFGLLLRATLAVLLLFTPLAVGAQFLSPEERARLEAEYANLQQEILEWQKVLDDTRSKKDSLQGDVTALTAQIRQAEAQIRQKNIAIADISSEIRSKTEQIGTLSEQSALVQDSLAGLLRLRDEMDRRPLIVIALSSEDFSDLFIEADRIADLEKNLQKKLAELQGIKTETEEARTALAQKQGEELDARYVVERKKQSIAEDEAEKSKLLAITENEEQEYQRVLAERQRRAEQIRSALFDLRDSDGIPFGTALNYATYASERTGVRPALILAILSQESDLGKNVGSCYVVDLVTGDGVGKNTGTPFPGTMKVPRDTVPFERITKALGRQWATSPVSCPVPGGYGGAMGPSQFIPSTWELFTAKLQAALGVSQPNPWNPQHAVMATAIYMADLGADLQTYSAERNAACRYYSGRSCDTKRPINYTYGNAVIAKAEAFQEDIDFLKEAAN
jgi:membrane-bound lytic murein transglycosylase B